MEEQFYLVFPILLWALWRVNWGRWTRQNSIDKGLLLVWAASFALSASQVKVAHRAAFYLPTSRAWELLTGSLAAFWATSSVRLPDKLAGRAAVRRRSL